MCKWGKKLNVYLGGGGIFLTESFLGFELSPIPDFFISVYLLGHPNTIHDLDST